MWVTVVLWVVSMVVSVLLAPKPEKPAAGEISNVPTAEAGRSISVLFGSRLVRAPNVVWWGDVRTVAIKKKSGFKRVTVGYKYYVGMHMVLCHAAAKIKRIVVGERDAWTGSVTATSQIYINNPYLFGGPTREGGIQGYVDLEFGDAAQGRNSYLSSKLGATVPAHRGVVGIVLRQVYVSALTPYIKPWSVEMERTPNAWYAAKAAIGVDANPAHIIYELLTNADWGLGYATADIDEASFTAAADTLYTEGFGISILWDDASSINDFLRLVLEHIDGTVFVDPLSGLFKIKLMRNDYSPSLLQGFDAQHIINVDSFDRTAPGEMFNTLTLNWLDHNSKQQATTVHDIAGISAVGQQIAKTVNLHGITTAALALKVAMRELTQVSRPIARCTVTMTRAASGVKIGDVIKLTIPEQQFFQTPVRVGNISYGTLADGRIRLDVVEDVFSMPAYAYTNVQAGMWTSPYTDPADAPYRVQMEAPYWTVARDGETPLAELSATGGFLLAGAGGVSSDTINYTIWTRQGASDYVEQGQGEVTPTCTLLASMTQSQTSMSITNGSRLEGVEVNTWAVINPGGANEEIVAVKTIDIAGGLFGIARGVLDTTPWTHAVGERVWFIEGDHFLDATEYLTGAALNVKTLTQTSLGTLALTSATQDSFTFAARNIKPYAPGKVTVNTVAYPASVTGDLTIAWAHRDRLTQTAYLVEQTEADIGPEAGTTYTVRIYNAQTAGTLIRTYTGLTGTSQAYTVAQATTDNGGAAPANLRIEIESVRGGYTSKQFQSRAFSWV